MQLKDTAKGCATFGTAAGTAAHTWLWKDLLQAAYQGLPGGASACVLPCSDLPSVSF